MPAVVPPAFHARLVIDSTNNALRVTGAGGTTTQTVAVGSYYIRSHTAGGDTSQLLELIDAAVEVNHGAGNFRITVSNDGIINVYNDHATIALTLSWTFSAATTALRDILGFTGSAASLGPGGSTLAGPNQHRFGWYPGVPPSDFFGDADAPGRRDAPDGVVTRAPGGQTYGTSFGPLRDQLLQFEQIAAARAVYAATQVPAVLNRAYETFWLDAVRSGTRLRYYPSRDALTAPGGGVPWEYVPGPLAMKQGTSALKRHIVQSGDLYDLDVDLLEYVA